MLIIDRPALLVLLLIPFFYELIESEQIYKKKLKALFLLVLWTNLHGSFALFFLLLGYKTLAQALKNPRIAFTKDRLFFFMSTVLATLINPWGWKIYDYVLQTAAISKVRMGEWQLLTLFENGQVSFDFLYFLCAVIVLIFLVIKRRKIKELFLSPLPVILISAFLAVRNVPLFFTVFPLFWGKYLANSLSTQNFVEKASLSKIFAHRGIVFLLILSGIYMFTEYSEGIRSNLSKHAQRYDETSAFRIGRYLHNLSGKKIFNDWLLGSFFMYSQKNQIFIDTRNIIYDDLIYKDYLKTVENKDGQAEDILKQYQIDYVVSEKTKPLTAVLKASKNWTFIMDDNGYSLFEKK